MLWEVPPATSKLPGRSWGLGDRGGLSCLEREGMPALAWIRLYRELTAVRQLDKHWLTKSLLLFLCAAGAEIFYPLRSRPGKVDHLLFPSLFKILFSEDTAGKASIAVFWRKPHRCRSLFVIRTGGETCIKAAKTYFRNCAPRRGMRHHSPTHHGMNFSPLFPPTVPVS